MMASRIEQQRAVVVKREETYRRGKRGEDRG